MVIEEAIIVVVVVVVSRERIAFRANLFNTVIA